MHFVEATHVLILWADGRSAVVTLDDYLMIDGDELQTSLASLLTEEEAAVELEKKRLVAQ